MNINKRYEDWVINKSYNRWWIGGIHSFLCGEHPVCSPLCIRTRSREAPANRWYTQGMSGMQVHECLNNSHRPGLLTHCPVKRSTKKKGQQIWACAAKEFRISWTLWGLCWEGWRNGENEIKRNKNQNQNQEKVQTHKNSHENHWFSRMEVLKSPLCFSLWAHPLKVLLWEDRSGSLETW